MKYHIHATGTQKVTGTVLQVTYITEHLTQQIWQIITNKISAPIYLNKVRANRGRVKNMKQRLVLLLLPCTSCNIFDFLAIKQGRTNGSLLKTKTGKSISNAIPMTN